MFNLQGLENSKNQDSNSVSSKYNSARKTEEQLN